METHRWRAERYTNRDDSSSGYLSVHYPSRAAMPRVAHTSARDDRTAEVLAVCESPSDEEAPQLRGIPQITSLLHRATTYTTHATATATGASTLEHRLRNTRYIECNSPTLCAHIGRLINARCQSTRVRFALSWRVPICCMLGCNAPKRASYHRTASHLTDRPPSTLQELGSQTHIARLSISFNGTSFSSSSSSSSSSLRSLLFAFSPHSEITSLHARARFYPIFYGAQCNAKM